MKNKTIQIQCQIANHVMCHVSKWENTLKTLKKYECINVV